MAAHRYTAANHEIAPLMSEDDFDPTDDDLAAVEVIYRAMWEDESPGLHELVARSFRSWAQSQHPHLEVADVEENGSGNDGVAQANGRRVDLTRATRTDGGVTTTTLELTEHAAAGRSVVTARVLSGDGSMWVWVDVNAPHPVTKPAGLSPTEHRGTAALGADAGQSRWTQLRATGAESLVSELLDASQQRGGRPHLGREPLTTSPVPVANVEHAKAIRNALVSPDRPVPYLVLAWDLINPRTALGETTRRAQSAALQVAGLARVFVMPLETLLPFQRVIGGEMDLEPGEARLYLPGEHEPHRHRTLAAEFVRSDPHQAGRWAGHLLRLAMIEREPPPLFDRSQVQLGSRRRPPELASGTGFQERITALASERDDLWEALFETREQRAEQSQQILDMQEELELAQLRAEELQEKLIDKEDQMVEMLVRVGEAGTSMVTDASGRKYPPVTSVSHALQLARANLLKVEIPPEAESGVAELDNMIEARSWARSVFDGLLALEAYAHSGAGFGDFREWCKSSKHPRAWYANSKKLAMRESEEVMRRPELSRLREMPVSERVSNSGRITMEAHLKLSNGSLAPRLYFHDDSGGTGSTGKVHVGYIGPHLPTKRFKS